jgi:hypothetical protein
MNRLPILFRCCVTTSAIALAICSATFQAKAASWNGIEPFKSRRAEVTKILGQPISESADGTMRFNVMGGSVQVTFVNEKFVESKKLRPELAGTVLEIVLQHDHSSDTPESLKLGSNRSFTRDETQSSLIFRNPKDGIAYTFQQGTLRTTRYTFADGQLTRARR